jgi:hypothetical protein
VQKLIGGVLLFVGVSGLAFALPAVPTPEIDAGSAANAVALLLGAVMMVRGRKKR